MRQNLCRKCGTELNKTNWFPSCRRRHSYICKRCNRKRLTEYYLKHKEKMNENSRRYYLRNRESLLASRKEYRKKYPQKEKDFSLFAKYGKTRGELDIIAKKQKGCAICGIKWINIKKNTNSYGETQSYVVDHKHGEYRMRGLLCRTCNLMIGYAFENSKVLRKAADYIELYKLDKYTKEV